MRFQSPQRGGLEQIYANFYLVFNEWNDGVSTNTYITGLRGPNLKGCLVSFVRSRALQDLGPFFGAAVAIGADPTGALGILANDSCEDMVLGVLDSDMVMGRDPLSNCWISVQVYGHCDQIACSNDIALNDDYLCMQENGQIATFGLSNRGIAVGYGRPGARAVRRLQGLVQITLPNPPVAGNIVVSFDGTDIVGTGAGSSSWFVPPGKLNNETTDVTGTIKLVKGDAPVVAMRYDTVRSGVPFQVPLEVATGGSGIPGYTKGFVLCMGFSKNTG